MEELFLRKLKTISSSFLRPGDLFFQKKTPIQVLDKSHKNQNLDIPEKFEDVKEEPLLSSRSNADNKQERIIMESSSNSTLPPRLKPAFTVTDNVKLKQGNEEHGPLLPEPENKSPQETKELVILYTTSLRGIRKTFEDCNAIRFLLQSFRVVFHERDVSMHLEYREELWRILGGNNRVVPPSLFIRGKYIGGADEVVGLHENGMLVNLLHGVPLSPSHGPCNGCGGMHFLLCFRCNGSRKLVINEGSCGGVESIKCPECNENGLVKCSVCS